MTVKLPISIATLFISILFCIFFSINGLAAENYVDDITSSDVISFEKSNKDIEENDDIFFAFFDGSHNYISTNVESLARGLDEYLSTDKVEYKNSGTVLRVREDIIWSDSDGVSLKTDIRLKLRLPHTQKKTRLVFQSRARDRHFAGSDERYSSFIALEKESDEPSAEEKAGGKSFWRFRPSIGLYLGSMVDTYIKFRVNHQQSFGRWSISWDETPYFVDSFGWGFDSYFEISRDIAEQDLFRSATFAGWRHDNNYFELSQFFSMNYWLSNKSAISYFTGLYGITEPKTHTTEYLFGITYRRNLHKKYLFLEVKPEVKYRKINSFEPEHSLIFRLEMLFNK